MIEKWRACSVYSKYYEISDRGRIRRSLTAPKTTGTRPGKIINPWLSSPKRTPQLMVTLSANGKTRKYLFNRLVCEVWHGPSPTPKHQAAHWDGNSLNNDAKNLRWATQTENEKDKIRHGTYNHAPQGSKCKFAKLTETDIPQIRSMHKNGLSLNKIGRKFGINHSVVNAIVSGRRWKHV